MITIPDDILTLNTKIMNPSTFRKIQVVLFIIIMTSNIFTLSAEGFSEEPGRRDTVAMSDTANPVQRSLDVDVGAELFAKYAFPDGGTMAGIGAIMVDADLRISPSVTGFGAFRFDGRSWYNYLNRGRLGDYKQEAEYAFHVEEFFVLWQPIPLLEIKAGRRYSRISPANQLHLADFEFNAKPRIFTAYMGENYGLGVDGISMQWNLEREKNHLYWLTEASKNSMNQRDLMITSSLGYIRKGLQHTISLRGFIIADHESWRGHRLLGAIHPLDYAKLYLIDEMDINTWGTSLVVDRALGNGRSLRLQGEYISQQIGGNWFRGGYAFLHYHFRPKWQVNLMYQALEVPELHPKYLLFTHNNEQIITAGFAWLPNQDQRIRIEYTPYFNLDYYVLLFKYTFMVRP